MKPLAVLRLEYAKKLARLEKKDKKRKSKYNNKITKVSGRSFHSGGESRCYLMLRDWEKKKLIKNLRCQVRIKLSEAEVYWKADFAFYNCQTNEIEVAEYKGAETYEWLLKKNLYKVYGPYRLRIFYADGKEEVIIPSNPMNLFDLT